MCGITGFLAAGACSGDDARAVVERMTTRLAHRGPDASGVWVDGAAGIALGHRRLSIIDLSPAGAQPMHSADGRWVISYNGEVYNHVAIAKELCEESSVQLSGHSDTEVLAEGFSLWGVEQTLRKSIGMFAVAAWDRQDRRLYLARDRLGIKPLYWAKFGGVLSFGSELSALRAHPSFEAKIDREALALYFQYSNVPAPLSIYRGVYKLEPGTILTAGPGRDDPVAHRFWSAAEVASAGHADAFRGSYDDGVDELERVLGDAVALRMQADVPLGAFLSGGIDSSLIVALMQARSTRPVKTFTIGFREASFDESIHAKAVASALGTDHTELTVFPKEAQAAIPELPRVYDEPFADSSMIPTLLVSRLTRRSVTVALSGDGGDELFGGYNRHLWAPKVWQAMRRVPLTLRRAIAAAIRAGRPGTWDTVAAPLMARLPPRLGFRLPGDKLHKLAAALPARTPRELYAVLTRTDKARLTDTLPRIDPWRSASAPDSLEFVEQMMLLDLITYLPDDILTKVDRASMAVGLEARVPILDHRVVSLAWSFPANWRIKDGVTKAPLRDLLARYLPRKLMERPKAGFGIPVGEWVRGPLRDWAEAQLSPARLREGFLDAERVRRLWSDHLHGRANSDAAVWSVLMFQAWLAEQAVGGA